MIAVSSGLAQPLLLFVLLAATVLAVGGWVLDRLVVPRLRATAEAVSSSAISGLGRQASVLGAIAILAISAPRLIVHAAALAEPGESMAPMVSATLQTMWGWALAAQTIGAGLVLVTMRLGRPRLAAPGILLLIATPAMMGHAFGDPDHPWLSITVDVIHVAAAGGWIGTLALLALLAHRARRATDADTLVADLFTAFHPIALVCALSVFASGLATAWLRMGAPEGLATGTYSGLFVSKVLLVFATGFVGATHAKLGKKRALTVDSRAMRRSLWIETTFAVLVIAITAWLVITPPIA